MPNSGYEIPINSVGTYSLLGDVCYDAHRRYYYRAKDE